MGSESLLAIYCPKFEERRPPFQYAASCVEKQLNLEGTIADSLHIDRSDDVGTALCSDRMMKVIACLPQFVGYEVVITSFEGIAAVGIGTKRQACDRAAYLALAITAPSDSPPSQDVEHLIEQAAEAETLKASWRVEVTKFTEPAEILNGEFKQGTHAVVWHIEHNIFKAFFSWDLKSAQEMYFHLVDSPYAAALIEETQIKMHYGRYEPDWWRKQLCIASTTGDRLRHLKAKLRCDTCSQGSLSSANFCSQCGARLNSQPSAKKKQVRGAADWPAQRALEDGAAHIKEWDDEVEPDGQGGEDA